MSAGGQAWWRLAHSALLRETYTIERNSLIRPLLSGTELFRNITIYWVYDSKQTSTITVFSPNDTNTILQDGGKVLIRHVTLNDVSLRRDQLEERRTQSELRAADEDDK